MLKLEPYCNYLFVLTLITQWAHAKFSDHNLISVGTGIRAGHYPLKIMHMELQNWIFSTQRERASRIMHGVCVLETLFSLLGHCFQFWKTWKSFPSLNFWECIQIYKVSVVGDDIQLMWDDMRCDQAIFVQLILYQQLLFLWTFKLLKQ